MEKQQRDREHIYVQEKEKDKLDERINLLEMAVFNKQNEGGKKTLFDEMDEKILNLQIEVKSGFEELNMQHGNFKRETNNEIFNVK